ncbi:MAG: hypothetical protein RJA06_1021 [Bacteroidota bacterium]
MVSAPYIVCPFLTPTTMNKIAYALLGLLILPSTWAQITLNTTTGSTGYTGSNSCGTGATGACYITFLVENTTTSPIQITQVGQWTATTNNSNTADLYTSTTSLAGPITGNFVSTAPPSGWSLAASGTVSGITATGVNPVLSNINVVVPGGSSIRFALVLSGTMNYSGTGVGTASPNTFSNSGINLKVGDAQISGANIGYGGTVNNPRFFTGSVSFIPLTPCAGTPSAGTTNTSLSAVCPLQNFNLSLTGATLASGISYQWESSSSATGPWTAIAGATSMSATVSQTVNTFYRCAITCSNSATTVYSNAVQVTTLPNLAGGTYTIGSGGTYPTFTAAFAAAACGVAGPVVFQVLTNSGPFNEQIVINEIPGMSATNTITVKGNNNLLSFASSNTNERHTLFLNGADFLRFEDLIIEAAGTTVGWAVRMGNSANNNTFKRCVIRTSETSTSSSFAAFTLTQSATAATGTQTGTASNLLIDSCQIVGGYYGLCLNGSGLSLASQPTNNTVRNTSISNFYIYGVYSYGQNNLTFEYNDINRLTRATVSTCYGLYNYGRNPGLKVVANRIHDLGGSNGTTAFVSYLIYFSSTSGTAASPVLVANNAIYNVNNLGSTLYGMYMLTTDTINVLHNTIDFNSNSGTGTATVYGVFFSGNLTQVNFKNNIIQIASSGTGNKFALYNSSTTALMNSNRNGIRFTSTAGGSGNFVAARSGTITYPSLAAWTAATGRDSNSISSDPIFTNVLTGDLTPISFAYNNSGENQLALVPLDLNRAARSTTPDIGAVEYTPSGCPAPFNVSVTNVRANSATVSYTSNATATNLQWGPKGFVPGTGQGTTVSTPSHTITGLNGYAEYDVYLQGNCGTQTSVWVGPYSFSTPVQVGWVENFANGYDPLAAVPKPRAWTERNAVAANPTPLGTNTSAWMLDGFLNVGTTGAVRNQVPVTSVATQGWTITPSIDLGNVAHTTYFEWDMGAKVANGTTAAVLGNDDTLFVFISTDNGTTWNRNQVLAKYHRGSGLSPFGGTYSVNLSSYTGLVKIAFYIESLTNSSTHIGANDYDLFLDNVALKSTPTPCPAATVSVVPSTNSASVSWTVGGTATTPATVAWGPLGFSIGSGGSGANQTSATVNPFTLSGLQPGTTYQVYVQSTCAATLGQWVGPVTFVTPCVSTLSGNYTIDSNGTGTSNFVNLQSALAAVSTCGITGPVTFTLAPYVHTGGMSLAALNGASATNTVTFQGPATGTATIQGVAGQFAAVTLNGTDFVTLRKLRIMHPTASGIILTGGAHDIVIDENEILADTTATASTIAGIASTSSLTSVTGYGVNANNITVTDNVIKGGYYGVRFNGSSTTSFNTGINLSGNTITKAYYYGTYFYYMGNLTINDNKVRNLRNTSNYGHYLYYVGNVNMERNETYSALAGITMGYLNNNVKPANNSVIANNMSAATNSYGAYLPYPRHVNMYHNTFSGSTYGLYLVSSTATLQSKNLNLRNNIFRGGTYALYQSGLPDSVTMDYNLYNSAATATFVYYNVAQPSLAAWKTAYPLLNVNSTDNPVLFAAANDLRVVNNGPNNMGTPIATVTTDIDGDLRSTTAPDLGADEFTPLANDLQVTALLVPGNNSCGDSNSAVSVVIRNLGTASQSNFGVGALISGAATASLSATYTGTLASLAADTVQVGTVNTVAGGTFAFKGYVALANDGKTSNDSLTASRNLLDALPRIPTASADTLCAGGFATLYFPSGGASTDSYMWLSTAGDTLGTSDSLLVGPMNAADTTFVLRPTSTSGQVGPLDNTIGATANYTAMNHYNLFTVNSPTTIYSVDVFATNIGLIDVVVQDAATLATVQTVTVSSTAPGFNRLVVNISLPPGNYRMGSTTTNNAGGLQRNSSGAVFPYLSTDGSVTITGTTFNATSYYYFYNWQLGSGGCPRPDGEVTLYHQAGPTASFTSTPQAATSTAMAVDFDASASTNATSYDWNFGDGSTGTGAITSHSYAANGGYNVTLIAGGVCGADTLVIPVTVAGINVAETPLDRSLSVYPNPNSGVFRVDFELGSAQRVEVKVLSATGQVVWVRNLESANGLQRHAVDLSEASAGLYLLQITSEEGVVTRRIAVQK